MQTVETLNEGLRRSYKLTIPAQDIAAKVDAEVKRAAPTIKMPGFRPGKVPPNLIKKMHGEALEREALNTAVQEGIQSLISEQGLRPAMQPQVELDEDYAAGKDVEVKVALEVLPNVPAPSIEGLKLERLTVEPSADEIDTQLARFAGSNGPVALYRLRHAFGLAAYIVSPKGAGRLLANCFPMDNRKIDFVHAKTSMSAYSIDSLMNAHFASTVVAYACVGPLALPLNDHRSSATVAVKDRRG